MVKYLKHLKSFIIMLIILAVIVGVSSFYTFPKEASPAINVPFFTLSVVYPGADPSTIEKQVVEKIESNLSSISGIKEIKSISAYNVGVISIEFNRDKNISEAYSDINSAVDKTKANFSDEVKEPILKRVDVTDSPIYTFSVVGAYLPNILYDKIESLEDKLQSTTGVSEVNVIGSYTPGIKIKFNYDKLLDYKLNLSYAISQIETYLDKFPADKKEIDNNLYTFTLRSYPDDFDEIVGYLENLNIVNINGNTILLKDIAKITTGPFMYKKEAYLMNKGESYSSITYSIKKIPGTDILKTIDNVKQVLKDYGLTFSESNFIAEPNIIDKLLDKNKEITLENSNLSDLQVFEINSQKEKIDSTYKTFISNFRQTTVIIFIVILLFIGFKESIGITLVFPLVYLISFVILKNIGYTFNNIVSFSLVLTLGIMVDNLIVIIEGFEEGMKEGLEKREAIGFSIKTYWKPIVSGNFTTISMFLPIGFMLSGKIGDFMKYMPTTVDTVLIVSIFVSLVFLPIVLSSLNFKTKIDNKNNGEKEDNKLFSIFKGFFKFTIRNYKKSVFAFVLLFITTIGIASQFLRADFLPPVDTNNIYVNLKFTSNITLEENKEITSEISKEIDTYFAEHKGLLAYQGINIGDYKSLDPLDNVIYGNSFNPDLSYIDLKLTDKDFQRDYNSYLIMSDLKELIKKEDYSLKIKSLEFFIQKSGPSSGKDVNFYLVGNNLEKVVNFYSKIETELVSIPGTYDWSTSLEYTNGKIDIIWNTDKLKQFNITSRELDILIASIESSSNYEPSGILLKKLDDYSSDLIEVKAFTNIGDNNILDIMVPGRDIYLKQLIKDVKLNSEVKNLNHSDGKLILNIGAYKTKETSLGSITPIIEETIEKYQKEIPEVNMEYAGDVKDMQNSMKDLGKAFVIGILLMFSVLVLHFGRFKQAFLVLSVIPFLFIGAILLLTMAGLPFSFPAQLGMFGLMGVGVNDAILLIERYNEEMRKKQYEDSHELILNVVRARFKPVLLTTLTTVLGLSTLAIKDELWGSLAVAFIGGLLLGTFIILVYIPAMLNWGLIKNK